MEKMKVEIVSRTTLKPSVPTPHHLRKFNLSLLGQDVLAIHYGSVIFFYPSDTWSISQKSQSLKNSLSKILSHFYPLAGQLSDAVTIECNDEGACFIEAESSCQLKDLLANPDTQLLKDLVPSTNPNAIRSTLACILLVQLTSFACGGTAVAISVSQKVADASSFCTFIQSWTATCGREYGSVELPKLVGASLLPPLDTQQHVRDAEIVLAIILRSASAASQSKSLALLNVVNLRKRMVPPLPGNTIGNLILKYAVMFHEKDVELHQLVSKMKTEFTNVCKDKVRGIKSKKGYKQIGESRKQIARLLNGKSRDINTYTCTNLCGYPFHEMDFGWGKPIWVTSPSDFKNLIVLLDSKWGGIEAWVTLDELEMAIFERDLELRAVASSNPGVFMNYSRI
ncbi:hypothetical protein V6N12_021616 [Hibiscus sabdariffa]|uniref:Uncharacterized protein n=1 Tax=Hibiscus sabdariffa TaxID=183260 RepID=A0ABR2FS85_9ROSI